MWPIREKARAYSGWTLMQIKRLHEPGLSIHPDRLDAAVKANRKSTLAKAVLFFAITMTLDDLAVLRFPAYMIAAGGALGIVSFGSLLTGRRLTLQYDHMDAEEFGGRLAELERVGLLGLIGSLILLVAWFVMFSAGVPPWSG